MKAKTARKGKPTKAKRTYSSKGISVWFDRELHEKVKIQAEKANRSISNYLETLAVKDIEANA